MTQVENIKPYVAEGDGRTKSEQVKDMFDNIAPAYDSMNRLMTLGIDRRWRKKCVKLVSEVTPESILDIATGTGDLTIAMAKAMPDAKITGVDLSEKMLALGRKKIAEQKLEGNITLQTADALNLPFDDNSFDAVTIAFGVRNFEHLDRGYAEMARVLRPGGKLVVLELSSPASKWVKPFYRFYTKCIIPAVGRFVSKDRRAYSYLPESIAAVPARSAMTAIMESGGLTEPKWKSLTFGVATIYTASKTS